MDDVEIDYIEPEKNVVQWFLELRYEWVFTRRETGKIIAKPPSVQSIYAARELLCFEADRATYDKLRYMLSVAQEVLL